MQKVYTIYWKQPEEYTSDLRVLDGDFKQVYPTGFEFNPVTNSVRIDDSPRLRKQWGYQGLPVDMTHAPTMVQYKGRSEEMADLMMTSDWFLASERFRGVIEDLEPGKHQFQPVELVDKSSNHLADYFWFVPCARVDGMDRDHTTHDFREGSGFWMHSPKGKFVVSLRQTADHHLWIDPRMGVFRLPFISPELKNALERAGLEGVGFHEIEAL